MSQPVAPSVTQQPQPRTRLPLVDHALKAGGIQNDRAIRAANNAVATAQLLLSGLDIETLKEIGDLQQAAWKQLAALQKDWVRQWTGWFSYADKITGANTMSKLVDMESSILARATQLLGSQFTSLVALQENIEVDYAYLVKQILSARQARR